MKKSKPYERSEKIYDDIMFNAAGCSSDCTGLIPSAVTDNAEYESYEEIYDFNLPKSVKEDIENH